MAQYVSQPVYNLSDNALLASLFPKRRDQYKVVSQNLDNEADVSAFRWNLSQSNNGNIIVVLIIIAVVFVVFKYVKL